MKATSLLSMKPRWPKIHHPLPQTPRESQQLLSALTSSFRRHLDAAEINGPAQSASQHMESILQNPLFRIVPPKSAHAPLRTEHEKAQLKERIANNPIMVFDELAAAGTLIGPVIGECLEAQLALIDPKWRVLYDPKSKNVREQMKKTGAGKRVVEWFYASDSFARKSFFKYQRNSRAALMFMVAEGLYEEVNNFIRALGTLDVGGENGRISKTFPDSKKRVFNFFLRDYINAELSYGRGLAGALQTFNLMFSLHDDIAQRSLFEMSAIVISRFILKFKESEELKSVPPAVFEDYCTHLKDVTGLQRWHYAMPLYHPTDPNTQPLLDHIQNSGTDPISSLTDMQKDDVIQIYLDALRLLTQQKNFKEARQISSHIESLLSDDRLESTKASDQSPELGERMGRLNLALG